MSSSIATNTFTILSLSSSLSTSTSASTSTSTSRARKVVKVQRGIAGASIEDIAKKIQAKKPKNAATEAALKEVKERAKAAKKSNAVARPGAGAGGQAPKVQVKHTAKVVTGGKR